MVGLTIYMKNINYMREEKKEHCLHILYHRFSLLNKINDFKIILILTTTILKCQVGQRISMSIEADAGF
jgi:hypothetical protein